MRFLMRLLPFLAIFVVGAGTMLLGVDLMTLPQTSGSRSVSAPNKLAQHEVDQRAEKTEGDVSRPLTPLYPANPGGTKDVRMVYSPSNQPAVNETTGTAPSNEPRVGAKAEPPVEPKIEQNSAVVPSQPARLTPPEQQKTSVPQPAPRPVQAAALAPNHCDVQACSNAYSSFRAVDCTYQPFEGPRRACIAPPMQRSTERAPSYGAVSARAQRNVVPTAVEPENAVVDDEDDAAGFMGGRRVIILDRNYRPWH